MVQPSKKGKIHICAIVEDGDSFIVVEERIVKLNKDLCRGTREWGIFYTTTPVDYHKKMGIRLPRHSRMRLSKRYVEFLDQQDCNLWIDENIVLGTLSFPMQWNRFDLSAINLIADLCKAEHGALKTVSFSNHFVRTDGVVTSVCYVEYLPSVDEQKIRGYVQTAAHGYGSILRPEI